MKKRVVEDWFLGLVSVQPMVVNRVVLGGVLSLHALSRIPEFDVLYGSAAGSWSGPYREFVNRFLVGDLAAPALWLTSLLAEAGPELRQWTLIGLYGISVASSLAFVAGFWTRTAGMISIAMHLLFLTIHPFAHYGWASMMAPFTLYVVFSRAGEYWSIDAWRKRNPARAKPPTFDVPAWPMRLLQVHVATMYFHTGSARIDDSDWLRGEVLFVFLLEPLAAVLLWIPRVRTLCALALIAMHVCLEILTNVGWWNYIMIAGLLTFLPTPWFGRLFPERP
jgi:hypothetical protein